jgi:limonene-1,2-epoxide hydrolase
MVANDSTIIMERVDSFTLGDKNIQYEIAVAFDIDSAGRIKRWHEYYDRQSIIDQISADAAGSS